MVEVVYDGNLGNNLFQYCFGRILAERLGYSLKAAPIDGFPGTSVAVGGKNYEGAIQINLRGQSPDLSFLMKADPRRHILLTGYFQRFEYYEHHRRQIGEWLATTSLGPSINAEDAVVGVRRGRDYIPQHGLPLSYYEDAIGRLSYSRLFICTNDASDRFVRHLAKKFGAIIRPPNALDNFSFIKSFNKIVISNSTFLWWAAFLSSAQTIICPVPASGFWSQNDPLSAKIDLRVPESRYVYVSAEMYKAEFLTEKVRGIIATTCRGLKAMVQRIFPGLKRKPLPRKFTFSDV